MVHIKYPSMERQDLTQGQLGSFKFTPIDELHYQFSRPYSRELLAQQYAATVQFSDRRMQHPHTSHSTITTSPSFFNSHIKPDLNDSRLRLGPAALRAAVESASSSPQKHLTYLSAAKNMRPSAHAFHPNQSSLDHDWPANMSNAETSEVDVQEHPTASASMATNPSASLLRALENEQQAHELTRLSLENEIAHRMEHEAEAQRLRDHNKTLLNSIRLLQSTIKHMVQKQEDSELPDEKLLDTAVQEFKKRVKNSTVKDTILGEPITKPEATRKSMSSNGNKLESNDTVTLTAAEKFAAHDIPAVKAERRVNDKSEPGDRELTRAYEVYLQRAKPPTNLLDSGDFNDDIPSYVDDEHLVKEMEKLRLNPRPALQLPEHFLRKYSKPVEKQASPKMEGILQPSNINVARKTSKILLPQSPAIDWKITNDNPIFKNNDDLQSAVRGHQQHDSYFSQHPVRYVPNLGEKNIFRTVMIEDIPINAECSDVLDQIRGGGLESIQLIPPIGKCTDTKTARIVFKYESGAFNLYRHGQNPGIQIGGQKVRVWQILEPTYPRNQELEEAIYEEGYTRLLLINPPNIDLIHKLPLKLNHQAEAGFVLRIGKAFDTTPMVEFTSIEEAIKALKILLDDSEFSGTVFDFEDDYCEQPYA